MRRARVGVGEGEAKKSVTESGSRRSVALFWRVRRNYIRKTKGPSSGHSSWFSMSKARYVKKGQEVARVETTSQK